MNITLDQLKEIAKAGCPEAFDYIESLYKESEISYKIDVTANSASLVYYIRIEDGKYIHGIMFYIKYIKNRDCLGFNVLPSMPSGMPFFTVNSLAAIRKMEELGIIEK